MKTFEAIFSCNFPNQGYPTLLEIRNVPVDYFPYTGIADNEEAAKESLLDTISDLMPDEIWLQEEKYVGLYQANVEIVDRGDCFFLQICKETVNPVPLKWRKDDAPGQT